MTTPPAPLWAGRSLALLGIVLVGFNLRSAVASLSPLVDLVRDDIDLPPVAIGLIGTMPPLCYAIFGVFAPALARRFGLERMAVVAMAILSLGLLCRGLAPDATFLVLTSAVTFAGMGIGNVLIPPLVKVYFPDRIAMLTTIYITAMSVSTFVPPLVAVPIAEAASWRLSLGLWAVFAAAALIPWLALLAHPHRLSDAPEASASRSMRAMLRSPIAWGLTALFIVTSAHAYTAFAWLPTILTSVAGIDAHEAGAILAAFAFVGLPSSLLVPAITARRGGVWTIVGIATIGGTAGWTGLLLAPAAAPWVWVLFTAAPTLLFPMVLTLVNLRTRSASLTAPLSGFVQSIGYGAVALVPLGMGLLFEATGSWTAGLIIMLVLAASSFIAGAVVARPQYIDDADRRA